MSAAPANLTTDGRAPASRPPHPAAPATLGRIERAAALALAIACAAILGVAMWLTPSPSGSGTHRQLGLAPCGFMVTLDMPCPSCGMTTAFSHAVRGHLARSFLTQPMGCALALLTGATLLVAAYVAATGSTLGYALTSRFSARLLLYAGLFAVAAWVYKILLHRGFLPFISS